MGSGGHNVPLVKVENGIRKLTPRECANLQGFPKDFVIPTDMADVHLYHQFGNSVTVPLIRRIAKNLVDALS
jgi:DNA (cytosine-5)-methyltransferase 1